MNLSVGRFPSGVEGICNNFYGEFSKNDAKDCIKAMEKLETGKDPVPYNVNRGGGDRLIPFNREFGKCMIQVEMAGQHPPQTFNIAPDEIRSLADIIYNQCVLGQRGSEGTVGGFITTQTTALKEWITAPTFDFSTPYPPETAYLTVSFSHPVPDWLSGGDNDPIMAFVLSDTALKAQDKAKPRTPLSRSLLQRAERFFDQGVRMEPRGQRIHWWELRPQLLQLPPLNVSASAIDLPSTENTTAANTATARRRRRDTKERTANPL